MEIDALVAVVKELGRLTGVATPVVDVVLALVQERGTTLGLYRPLAMAVDSVG
jgi:2-dehydropantoate 2-reductase